jgi:hypothetical protein
VVGDKNVGELHDRLLRVGRQDAYQKYCQRQELQQTDWEFVHGDPLFIGRSVPQAPPTTWKFRRDSTEIRSDCHAIKSTAADINLPHIYYL